MLFRITTRFLDWYLHLFWRFLSFSLFKYFFWPLFSSPWILSYMYARPFDTVLQTSDISICPPPPHWAHLSPAPFWVLALLAVVGSCRYLDALTLKSPRKLWPLVPLHPLAALPPIHFPHWLRIHKRVAGKELPSHWVGMDHNDLVPSMVLLQLPWWLRGWRICLPCGRSGFIPCVQTVPGGGHGNPFQYSCL